MDAEHPAAGEASAAGVVDLVDVVVEADRQAVVVDEVASAAQALEAGEAAEARREGVVASAADVVVAEEATKQALSPRQLAISPSCTLFLLAFDRHCSIASCS